MVDIYLPLSIKFLSNLYIYIDKTLKKGLNFSKYRNVISFTATVDTLHVHVSVARNAKKKKYFYVNFNNIINSQLYKAVQKKWEIFKTALCKFIHTTIGV